MKRNVMACGSSPRPVMALVMVMVMVVMLSFSGCDAQSSTTLPKFNVDPASLTVSGVSSGAAMAVQLHVAFSANFVGVAAFAGAPYWCAMDNLSAALTSCMSMPSLISLPLLWGGADAAYLVGSIDNPANLAKSKVWLFSGLNDTVVDQGVVDKTYGFYKHYTSSIKYYNNMKAEHSWVTNDYGNPCAKLGTPYINNCNFDGAGDLLTFFFGNLNAKVTQNSSNLRTFDQKFYTPLQIAPSDISMDNKGYYYVPTACQKGARCKLHVSLHGCEQGVGSIGTDFVTHNGLNGWAEANNIVVLYPQAAISSLLPYNPKGCWDWWGYTLPDYATQIGPQMSAISSMLSALGA